ncbi:hypothetical protein AB6A40_003638 [Gnathostoma spinigerum]|uniref:Uncharacterized protein n=1 Tax=Gnathostoma spinigerum TaxID=75299 RepID=A0ABD6EFP1_9BILA
MVWIFIVFCFAHVSSECIDNVTNVIHVGSFEDEDLPVFMEDLHVLTYDADYKPSCANGKPNVVLPGYATLIGGKLTVSKNYHLKGHSIVKMTMKTKGGTYFCRDGESIGILPNYFCRLVLCKFIGDELCEVLQKKGTHNVQELIDKANFNNKLKLPSPPCIFNLCLTDLFGGDWHTEFFLEYKGKRILHFQVPSIRPYLQVAVTPDSE